MPLIYIEGLLNIMLVVRKLLQKLKACSSKYSVYVYSNLVLTRKNRFTVTKAYIQAIWEELIITVKSIGCHQDVVPLYLPIFHLYGLAIGLLQSFSCGCKIITIQKFGSEAFVKLLERKPTIFHAVPPIGKKNIIYPNKHFSNKLSIFSFDDVEQSKNHGNK